MFAYRLSMQTNLLWRIICLRTAYLFQGPQNWDRQIQMSIQKACPIFSHLFTKEYNRLLTDQTGTHLYLCSPGSGSLLFYFIVNQTKQATKACYEQNAFKRHSKCSGAQVQ
jgi:hypothetical protein